MNIFIPAGAADILDKLEAAGYRAWLVGGCVRDALRGVSPADYDIATTAQPHRVADILKDYRLLPTGIKHGTLTALGDDGAYEVTTLRLDGPYTDHRRPDSVSFTDDIVADLSRRDFTIGAMAYHPKRGLVDPFGGQADLSDRLIRCVGDPASRFEEDALRILRAARFASVLNFSIEDATRAAMAEQAHLLRSIAAERVFAELLKALVGPGFGRVFGQCDFLLPVIIPETEAMIGFEQRSPYHAYNVYTHTLRAVDACPNDPTLRLAMLLHDIGKPGSFTMDAAGIGHFKGHANLSALMSEIILHRLRCESRMRREVIELVKYHGADIRAEERIVRRWLGRLGETQLRRLIAAKTADDAAKAPHIAQQRRDLRRAVLETLDKVLAEGQAFSLRHLAVNGRDMLALGLSGPEVGRALSRLLEAVIEGDLPNQPAPLLSAVRDWMTEQDT
jgi:tRNA nucleotidyltransferase (CCA-adding enzyme)